MANEKKPSIYDDRSAIGSSSELDEYGVWVKSEPQDLSSAGGKRQETLEPGADTGFDTELGEELPDLDSLDDFGKFGTPARGDSRETAREDPFDLGDFVPEPLEEPQDAGETASLEAGAADEGEPQGENFTEMSLSEFLGDPGGEDESAGAEPPPIPRAEEGTAGQEFSTQLLLKIADELASIRTELSNLKEEFSVIRGSSAPSPVKESPAQGFFDEEDDEKIALTGDELNNIINTADFTEEAGLDVSPEPAEESGFELGLGEEGDDLASLPFPGEDLNAGLDESPLPGETPEEEAAPEAEMEDTIDLNFGETIDLDEPLPASPLSVNGEETDFSFPSEDFSLEEEGTGLPEEKGEGTEGEDFPLNPAPEDTAYLDESPLADVEGMDQFSVEGFDDTALDFSGEEIGEPDLSLDMGENSPEEPVVDDLSLDSPLEVPALDIDLEEETEAPSLEEAALPDDPTEEDLTEITLDSFPDLGDDASAALDRMEEAGEEELIPEGFIVEADDAPLLPEEAEAVNLAGEELGDFGLSGEGEDLSLDEPGGSEILPFPGTEQSGESAAAADLNGVSPVLTQELRTVLSYMDHLLESLPQDKIEEFAQSEYFDTYKKLFKELGLE